MGLLDFLFDAEKKEERKYAKLEKTLKNMYVQAAERGFTIEELRDLRSPEAVRVLLKRFAESAPNTTVDLEEKERVYDVLVELGAETSFSVVDLVSEYLRKADGHINWPLKVLTDLLSRDQFVEFLTELLGDLSAEYTQYPEKKQELMLRAQEFQDEKLAAELVRFLEDMNETVRFLAVDAVLAQDLPDLVVEPLAQMLAREESLRIVQKLGAAFASHQAWQIPQDLRAEVAESLPDEFGVHDKGHIYKHRR
jgi:hypothetical protein